MMTEPTRLHAHPGGAGPRATSPRLARARVTRPDPASGQPGVTQVAIWFALGVSGWAIVALMLVAGFRIFV